MISRADMVIGVADYSKFGVTAMNHICPLEDMDILVTDWLTPPKAVAECRSRGVEVHIVSDTSITD
jgi:DeoR/GlpR family transcriptional regulator of sugar metabolism